VIGRLVSRYDMLERLGEGGMGVVFLAEDTRLNRRVAIKFLTATDPQYRARFQLEARALSAFSHPNIATVHDSGETEEGRPFIVMELVKGPTLREVLEGRGLTMAQAVEIAISIAGALGEAHRNGIIHRDIKPANVIVSDEGHVKVLDFGLAKKIDEEYGVTEEERTELFLKTQSNVAVGTPLYFSPEQAGGKAVDKRSDLFSLGAVLYECLTGRSAFAGSSPYDIGGQVIHVNPTSPAKINPRVPAALDRLTMKALAKKPEDRFQSAEDLIRDLRAVRVKLPEDDTQLIRRLPSGSSTFPAYAPRTSTLVSIIEPLRRPRLSVATVLLGVLAVVLLGWGVIHLARARPHKPLEPALIAYEDGNAALRNGAFFQASKSFQKAVEIDPEYALAHARLAEVYTELEYSDRAKDELIAAGSLIPDRTIYPQEQVSYLDAITATISRNFAQATESYRKIAELNPDKPDVHADLGRAYEKENDIKKAIESYVEATKRDTKYAPAFLRLGSLYGRQGNPVSSDSAFKKADELYRQQNNREGGAEVYFLRGELYIQLNKPTEAKVQLEQALAEARATNNEYQKIKSLFKLSNVPDIQGDRAQAEAYVQEAMRLARANGMEALIASGLIDLGNTYLARDNAEAEKYFQQALDQARAARQRRSEARALLSFSSLQLLLGDPDKALSYAEQALPFYQQGNYNKEVSQALQLMARAHWLKGDFAAGRKALDEQLKLAEKSADWSQVARAYADIGVSLGYQEQYPQALEYFAKDLEINKSMGNQMGSGFSWANQGNVLWRLGRYDEALQAFDQAQTFVNPSDRRFDSLLNWLYLTRARMAVSQGHFKDAELNADQCAALAEARDLGRTAEVKAVKGLAQVWSGQKAAGMRECAEAYDVATRVNNQEVLCTTQLALTEAMVESGDMKNAWTNALQAQELARRLGKQDSEWRAMLFAARASQLNGDWGTAISQASQGSTILSGLEQRWGTENYNHYRARPDVRRYSDELAKILALTKK
jgi:serine/threonine protein kinase/tetratricopeptide (TPR) repeat protein